MCLNASQNISLLSLFSQLNKLIEQWKYILFFSLTLSLSLTPSIYLSISLCLLLVHSNQWPNAGFFMHLHQRSAVADEKYVSIRFNVQNSVLKNLCFPLACSLSVSLSFFLCQHVLSSLAHKIKFSLQHHFIWQDNRKIL